MCFLQLHGKITRKTNRSLASRNSHKYTKQKVWFLVNYDWMVPKYSNIGRLMLMVFECQFILMVFGIHAATSSKIFHIYSTNLQLFPNEYYII